MENGKIIKKGSPSALVRQLQEMSCELRVDSKQAKRQSLIQEVNNEPDIDQQKTQNEYLLVKNQQLHHKQSEITLCTFLNYLLINKETKQSYLWLFFSSSSLNQPSSYSLNYQSNTTMLNKAQMSYSKTTLLFWELLCLLIFLFFIFNVLKSYFLERVIINSNKHFHENMVRKIVRSPCAFFDKTSVGSLHYKFSNDLGILDNTFSFVFLKVMEGSSSRIISVISICVLYPIFIFILPIFILIFTSMTFLLYFSPVIVECKRIDLQNKNPIYQTFNETINGLTQVRIYHRRKILIQQFSKMMNGSTKALINCQNISRGFGMSIFMLGWILVLTGMMMGINQILQSSYQNYAATILLLITFTENFQYLLRLVIYSQSWLLSYARVCEIIQLGTEKDLRNEYDSAIGLNKEEEAAQQEGDLHTMWPNNPSLEFVGLSARYSPQLPLCLDNNSFKVTKFSRIGIVGRTGAGKSSIVQAIFRMIEPEAGSRYSIDNYNAMKVGLHSLRQHICIIPQTPYLFKVQSASKLPEQKKISPRITPSNPLLPDPTFPVIPYSNPFLNERVISDNEGVTKSSFQYPLK